MIDYGDNIIHRGIVHLTLKTKETVCAKKQTTHSLLRTQHVAHICHLCIWAGQNNKATC